MTVMVAVRRAGTGGSAAWAVPAPAAPGLRLVNLDIAFFRRRAAADPWSAADRAALASLYLQRGRETGRYADFVHAEVSARRSLAIRRGRNARGLLTLASSLLAQHRFAEARMWAESLVAAFSEPPSHRALLGEIQLELGDYPAASRTFAALARDRANLAVAPRLARWAELRGREGEAHALLLDALAATRARPDLPLEQRAWFHLRLADLALRHGRLREAAQAIEAGLAAAPADARLASAGLRLAVQRGRWREAVRRGVQAHAAGADIATLALTGDAHAVLGDCAGARDYWEQAERRYREQPEPFARQWTAFRLDHGIALDSTRRTLEDELRARPDVLGWDLVAWARHLTGDATGARAAAREAGRLGTNDAILLYHAGIIAQAAGDSAAARSALAQSLALHPQLARLADARRSCAAARPFEHDRAAP